jgi:hypothetical protein
MNALTRRLDRLETVNAPSSNPAIKRWLGMALTPAEHAEADRIDAEPAPDVDWSNYSNEVREWLQC